MINREDVVQALQTVKGNDSKDVITGGIVSSIIVRGDSVGFALEVDLSGANNMENLRKSCEVAVKKISGVKKVTAVLTTTRESSQDDSTNSAQKTTQRKKKPVLGVKNIILVASGKGGVGKSTIAVNLAISLSKQNHKVGLLDADIYGPSIPQMLDLNEKPKINQDKLLIPFQFGDVQAISMGNLIDPDRAAIWRGPMATKALYQLFHGVLWQDVDYLIVDTPPGTGDIQLSLAEHFPVSGAVIVSTPQEIALADVKKAINMFRKVDIPILGMVENMSYFTDPESGKQNYIFGKDGAKLLAKSENIPFIGDIPLLESIRSGADTGNPIAQDEKSEISQKFGDIASCAIANLAN